jgi:hypothetical protein
VSDESEMLSSVHEADVVTCSPAWWVANAARVLAEEPVRLVRLTHYPDDAIWDDSASEVDPATGHYTFAPWPGVEFTFPPDCYDPTSWDYARDRPIPPAKQAGQ